MSDIGVIGGGIAGLTAAHQLRQHGASVQVLEATDRVGGVIRTTRSDGFLVEHGPNSLRPSPLLESTIEKLGLTSERVWADGTASTRYVVRDGRPVAIPNSVSTFLTTDLFSTRAKLRLIAEPLIPARPGDADEESLATFTRRRLGPEVLDYAVAPFVGGVFAGRPDDLSARHAFERLVQMEEEYGSLFWGALRSRGSHSAPDDAPSSLFSFRDGLETLPAALGDALDDCISRNAPVTALHHDGTTWTVEVEGPDERTSVRHFDALICTVPLHALRQIDFGTSVDRSPLQDVSYPPVSVIALGYKRTAVAHPLDGFGLLVPPVEQDVDVLGTIFSSTLFPERAPEDHVLLTTFVGGARAPSFTDRPRASLRAVVEQDLSHLLGVEDAPVFSRVIEWPQAIPQYTIGYGAVKDTLQALETEHDTLFFAGNYRHGVSVGDAMASGASAAEQALEKVRAST